MSSLLFAKNIEARFTPIPPQSKSVNATASQIVPGDRGGPAYIFNASSNTIYIGSDNTVTTNSGIPILSQTGFWLVWDRAGWFAIASTNNNDVRVTVWQ